MSSRNPKSQARIEAMVWYAALGLRRVTNAQVNEFFKWRDDPINNEAYEELEQEARFGPRTIH